MPAFVSDLRSAFRGLVHSPSFGLPALLTLALGIGAATTMFSAVHALLLRPLPYPHPERMVVLNEEKLGTPSDGREVLSNPAFFAYRDRTRSLESLVAYRPVALNWAGPDGPVRVAGGRLTVGFFELLGFRPTLGRFFEAGDETAGAPPVAVLSHRAWVTRFGSGPVLGRSVQLDGAAAEIVGVTPPDFQLPRRAEADFFIPIQRGVPAGSQRHLLAIGRIRPGLGREAAERELRDVAAGFYQEQSGALSPAAAKVYDLRKEWTGDQARPTLLLMSAVGFLLLIACVNVSGLLLARAAARRRDVAIRAALGAGSRRLFGHFFADGAALGLLGGLAGLALARLGIALLPGVLPQGDVIQQIQVIRLDPGVLLFALLTTLGASLAFALVPLAQARVHDLREALHDGGRSGSARGARLRTALVVLQVSLATMLVVSVGLFLRSFTNILRQDPGFRMQDVQGFTLTLPQNRFPTGADVERFREDLVSRLEALPGVRKVGAGMALPMSGGELYSAAAPYEDAMNPAASAAIRINLIDPGYLRALDIRLASGRGFDAQDTAGSAPVVIINRTLARRLFPGADPVGRLLHEGNTPQSPADRPAGARIVGVMDDIRTFGLDAEPGPMAFYPASQAPPALVSRMGYLLRTDLPAAALQPVLRSMLASMLPAQAPPALVSLEAMSGQLLSDRRQTLALLGLFASLALTLTAVGVFGVMSFNVVTRTREIGTRIAFGAQVHQILAQFLGHGLRVVALGTIAGIAGALVLGRFITSQLHGVSPVDPATLVSVVVVLLLTALAASLLPALRAARMNPLAALRQE